MPAGYPDFSWSVRVVRMLVVVAVAVLSGAVIGGASVYLISDALSPPPPSEAPSYAQSRADANTGNAIVVSATPPPSAAAPATASMTAEPPAATPPPPQPESPDALSRAHPDTAAAPDTDTQPAAPAPRAADNAPDDGNNNPPAARASNTDENRVASKPVRQRTVTRTKRPAAQGFAPSAVARTPIYDYYGQDVDRAQRRPGQSNFGGLFGRDRDDDWQRNDRNRRW
jgi:type IV secretory pathway VirB10-like protein